MTHMGDLGGSTWPLGAPHLEQNGSVRVFPSPQFEQRRSWAVWNPQYGITQCHHIDANTCADLAVSATSLFNPL